MLQGDNIAQVFYRDGYLIYIQDHSTSMRIDAWLKSIAVKDLPKSAGITSPFPPEAKLLNYRPADVVIDPELPLLYMADKSAEGLQVYNYRTGESRSVRLGGAAESLVLRTSELLVGLRGSPGAIAVLDKATLTLKEMWQLDADPVKLAVDQRQRLYALVEKDGKGQLRQYSAEGQLLAVSEAPGSSWKGRGMALHPELKAAYTFAEDGLTTHQLADGLLTGINTYAGYPPRTPWDKPNIHIFPDGSRIVNGSGGLWNESGKYIGQAVQSFTDMVFDPQRNLVLAGIGRSQEATLFSLSTRAPIRSITLAGEVKQLFLRGDEIVAHYHCSRPLLG